MRRLLFPNPVYMDMHTTGYECLEGAQKGCLDIRLFTYETVNGESRYGVKVTAWNAWADQEKIFHCSGGLDLDRATAEFNKLKDGIRDYDWLEDDFILEEAVAA